MKKNNKIIISLLVLLFASSVCYGYVKLMNNKTFFKNTYVGENKQEMFIPMYSYYDKVCCMYGATFYSLKSKKSLDNEIKNYLKDFEYFEDEHTYGYRKDDIFIQSYEVEDKILYRKIIIVY